MSTALNGKLVTIFGGSGFVGRHVVREIARRGYNIRVAVRRPDLAEYLRPAGAVGQVHPVQANLRYPDSVARAIAGADAVINLVGIMNPSGKQKFDSVHTAGAKAVVEAAKAAGLQKIIHMSALGVDANSDSAYSRSKAAGEAAVVSTLPQSIIFRPSVIFGPEDNFFNMLGDLARFLPVMPLIGGGRTKFQPIYVCDVAAAIANALDGKAKDGTVYELGGPEIKTFRECAEQVLKIAQRKRRMVSIPFGLAKFEARFLQMMPKPLLTVDQVNLLKRDNIVSPEALKEGRTIGALGIEPIVLAAVLPAYMERYREHGQYDAHKLA